MLLLHEKLPPGHCVLVIVTANQDSGLLARNFFEMTIMGKLHF